MSLGPALEAIRPAFAKENRNKMSRTVLAKHLGYSSLNGRALGRIGAVRAYGLIEGGGDELRISDDAVAALNAPNGSTERTAALGRLANKPSLFQELSKEFETVPSVDNLKFTLIKKGFTAEAAEKAAKSYLATFNLVGGIQDEYNPPEEEDEADMSQAIQQSAELSRALNKPLDSIQKPIQEVFNLPEGTVTITFPKQLSMESYQDLEDQLSLLLRRVKRQANKDDEAAN
ncbi:hypothetical protein CO675_33435 [Bradyrhizobium sp. C9]|nr:hypothetical protein CO675_33435 [Bradyrhizobium sp. C9]